MVALFVFALGLIATLYYWQNLRQSVQADMQAAYNRQADAVTKAMKSRIEIYENFLRGSAGLFAIHSNLTQGEWNTYHRPYDIQNKFSEIEGIGVARYLKKAELPAYLERRIAAGEHNFKIFPEGERDIYVPTTYDAPYTGNKGGIKGYDGYSDPVRREAMIASAGTGKLTMTGELRLISESRPNRSAFVLYLPVYGTGAPQNTSAERWSSLLGFVYIAVDMATFANTILNANQNPHIGLKMQDTSRGPGHIGYESANFAQIMQQTGSTFVAKDTELNGHTWKLSFAVSPEIMSVRERQLPQQALLRGLITCIFFAGLVWYLITDRERKYARQKTEEVQTAKDDLLSLASHQLRTPATVVKQYVGMLLQGYGGKLTNQQLNMLDNAYQSNERQLEIINQLLYVARLDAGRIRLHTKRIDLVELLKDVTHDQDESIRLRKQHTTFKFSSHPVMVEADPHYLRMVFENLLSNAIKYTPEEGHITMDMHRLPAGITVRIKDTGVGIDKNVQNSIFEKFTRVENELSTDVNGSGVGLYLTKQIVELHGGTIKVKSTAGKGAVFSVHLPFHPPRSDRTESDNGKVED